MQITPKQVGRLQTLYSQWARHEIGASTDREARLRWAAERLGRPVTSFKHLSLEDGRFLIDSLQGALGVKAPVKQRPSREQARRAGLDGRRDGQEFAAAPQMVTARDLEVLQSFIARLGWNEESFRKFQNSSRYPLARRADKQIRTTADANKVIWALKRILRSREAQKGGAAA